MSGTFPFLSFLYPAFSSLSSTPSELPEMQHSHGFFKQKRERDRDRGESSQKKKTSARWGPRKGRRGSDCLQTIVETTSRKRERDRFRGNAMPVYTSATELREPENGTGVGGKGRLFFFFLPLVREDPPAA